MPAGTAGPFASSGGRPVDGHPDPVAWRSLSRKRGKEGLVLRAPRTVGNHCRPNGGAPHRSDEA